MSSDTLPKAINTCVIKCYSNALKGKTIRFKSDRVNSRLRITYHVILRINKYHCTPPFLRPYPHASNIIQPKSLKIITCRFMWSENLYDPFSYFSEQFLVNINICFVSSSKCKMTPLETIFDVYSVLIVTPYLCIDMFFPRKACISLFLSTLILLLIFGYSLFYFCYTYFYRVNFSFRNERCFKQFVSLAIVIETCH